MQRNCSPVVPCLLLPARPGLPPLCAATLRAVAAAEPVLACWGPAPCRPCAGRRTHAPRAPQSLKYARVASVVRAAAFHITPAVRPGDLPFCGPVLAGQIADIASTGTTRQLEEHEYAARVLWDGL